METKSPKTKSNKEWKNQFRERLLKFAVRIIHLANKLPRTPAGFAIASQLIKAGTSIGANTEEAQDASSTRDFIQKLNIALREAKETRYWLMVVKTAGLIESKYIDNEIIECDEIIAILTSSVKSSKAKLV